MPENSRDTNKGSKTIKNSLFWKKITAASKERI